MGMHSHREHPWRVRVNGAKRGAGVLLDERHVLTCAHVVGDEKKQVMVSSAVCFPEWRVEARVARDGWGQKNGDTRRGDVALLRLAESAPCDARVTLWRAPLSAGRVRTHGFPRAEPYGISADAELAGDGGRGGELGLVKPVSANGQWIEAGFSGAGVLLLDGSSKDHVIGIIVADYFNDDAKAAWMMPTETILAHLPAIARYVDGPPANCIVPPDGGLPPLTGRDTLRVALTQELRRLLSGGWAGTVVLPGGGTATGTGWLVRLIRTADPAARAGTPDAELTAAPPGTVLELGAIDAACDAHGKPVAEIMQYLADRFRLPADDGRLIRRLCARQPPASLVIVGVDRAESPDVLIREVLRPLALRARTRGIRLVAGFDGAVPENLPYDVSLDPSPLAGEAARTVSAADAEERITELAAAEEDAARLGGENELRFRRPPAPPHACAPRLRVRLAVARGTEPDTELAAIDEAAVAALGEVASFRNRMADMEERLKHLRGTLEANRLRAERCFGAEDEELGYLHDQVARALWYAPIDLAVANDVLEHYVAEVDRRIEERGDNDRDKEDRG
jgi:hypothetical protein